MTTGEISAHFAGIQGDDQLDHRNMIEAMNDWVVRPLDEPYAAIFIDAIVVKVRDGQVANRPFCAADRGHPDVRLRHPRVVGRHRW